MDYIKAIENELSLKAEYNFLDMQQGDVPNTYADTSLLEKWINFKPATRVQDGVKSFIQWYKKFYQIS